LLKIFIVKKYSHPKIGSTKVATPFVENKKLLETDNIIAAKRLISAELEKAETIKSKIGKIKEVVATKVLQVMLHECD